MAWHNDDLMILRQDNLEAYVSNQKPSPDLLLGYREGVFDVLQLLQEVSENDSLKTVIQIRNALNDLRKNRFDLIGGIDKVEQGFEIKSSTQTPD